MTDLVTSEIHGGIGYLTLNRPQALNALSLEMIRAITETLNDWAAAPEVAAVVVAGAGGKAFCAGGDIRFFHKAALAGDLATLDQFFVEEYALNHLIHRYAKPYIALMDGVVMGGGMGISQGARRRLVTDRTRMAMPETNIGLFPDVGGGWFLARCPGHIGEYLALTGHVLGAADALGAGLADGVLPSAELPAVWDGLAGHDGFEQLRERLRQAPAPAGELAAQRAQIDRFFGLPTVRDIVAALEADASGWASRTAALLRARSPLMLHVTLEHVRRARHMTLAEDLRMERDLVRHCFHLRPGAASETVEGIRALAVDKDHAPRWSPARIEEVEPAAVAAFFASPWPRHAHPLRELA